MRLYIVDESEAGQFSGLTLLTNSEPLTVNLATPDAVSKLFKITLKQKKFIIAKSKGIDLDTQETKIFYVVIKRSADIDIYFSGHLQNHTDRTWYAIPEAKFAPFEAKLNLYQCHNQQPYFPSAPAAVAATPAPTPGPSKHGTPVSNHASRATSFAQTMHMSNSSSSGNNHAVNSHATASTGSKMQAPSTQVVVDNAQQSGGTQAQQPAQHAAVEVAVPSTPATNAYQSTAALVMTMTQTASTTTTVQGSGVANGNEKDAATSLIAAVQQTPIAPPPAAVASEPPTPVLNLDHVIQPNAQHVQQAPTETVQKPRADSIKRHPTQPLRLSSQRTIITMNGAVAVTESNTDARNSQNDVRAPLLPKSNQSNAARKNEAAQQAQTQPKSTSCCTIV